MIILRQVDRVARRLSKRQCCCCSLRLHPGDAYAFGWLASDPSVGSEAWQAWYARRAAFGQLARDLAFLFAQRVHVAMARGAKPEALGDLVAAYSPRRRVAA